MKHRTIATIALGAGALCIIAITNQRPRPAEKPAETVLQKNESKAEAESNTPLHSREEASPLPGIPAKPSLQPLPDGFTVADLNQLADSPAPLEERLAALMSSAHNSPRMAKACGIRMAGITPSAQFQKTLVPVIMDAGCPPELLDVLLLNLYERPLDQRLAAWAGIVRSPSHPAKEMALEGLRFHLGDAANATDSELDKAISKHLAGK